MQLTYRPAALDQLASFTSADMPTDTQGSRVLAAINALDCTAVRTLAKARVAWDPSQAAGNLTLQASIIPP